LKPGEIYDLVLIRFGIAATGRRFSLARRVAPTKARSCPRNPKQASSAVKDSFPCFASTLSCGSRSGPDFAAVNYCIFHKAGITFFSYPKNKPII
jgi:hypothetical protein